MLFNTIIHDGNRGEKTNLDLQGQFCDNRARKWRRRINGDPDLRASFVRVERTNGEDEINGQSGQMEKKKPMAKQWRRREAIERANSVKGEGFGGGKILRIRACFSE